MKTVSWFCLWKDCKFQSTSFVIDPFFLPLFQFHCCSKWLEMPRDLTGPLTVHSSGTSAQQWCLSPPELCWDRQTPGEAPVVPFPGSLAPPTPLNSGMVSA